jgi:hypothetical protein
MQVLCTDTTLELRQTNVIDCRTIVTDPVYSTTQGHIIQGNDVPHLVNRYWVWMLGLLVIFAPSCSKTREQQSQPQATTNVAATGVPPPTQCRYDSVLAASKLDIGPILSLDVSSKDIKEVIACSGANIQDCAGKQPQEHPVQGQIDIKLDLDTSGFAHTVTIASRKDIPETASQCVVKILKNLHYPTPPKDHTEATVTLRYSTQNLSESRFANLSVQAQVQLIAGNVPTKGDIYDTTHRKMVGCYLMALENNEKAAGTLTYQAKLDKKGKASSIQVTQKGTLPPSQVDCSRVLLESTTFPPSISDSATIKGTLILKRKNLYFQPLS